MQIHSLYFSPTGGTKKVLNLISKGLGEICSDIDLSAPNASYGDYSFSESDICLIGAPAFGGRVPSVALEHLRQVSANGAYAVLVATFGNRAYSDT